MITILSFSVLFQLITAVLAIRLIWVSKNRIAWLFISIAISLMTIRRSIHLFDTLTRNPVITSAGIWQELVALLISLLMLTGVILIAPVFRVMRNVNELKKQTNELEQANKLKEEFVAILSHEIRTPVSAIIGFTDVMLEEELSDTQKENLMYIHASANQLEKLLSNLLELSVMQSSKDTKINYAEFNIEEMINSIISTFTIELSEKGNTVAYSVETKNFYSDEMRIQQILFNLIGNAVKFTNNGNINITAYESDGFYVLKVADTGIGIPKEKQKIIFEMFEQGDRTNKRAFSGVGLGLAITKNFVNSLDGEIRLKSVPEKGSEFTVKIPVKHN